jgi:cobalt-zinc-cadmium resistance protein CzcA
MVLRGESANLLSVGAIDFGLIVDATVIMVESMFRRLAAQDELSFQAMMGYQAHGSDFRGKMLALFHGAVEVNRAILFAAAIIIVGFIPLFTLSGVEGHIFGPMAKTYTYAIAGGLIATFTITPAFSALLLPAHVEEAETGLMAALRRFYTPILDVAVRRKTWTLAAAAVLLCIAVLAVHSLGLEFLPKLEEGNLWIRATLPSTISLEEGNKYVNQMRTVISGFPEVESVVSQHGRPDDGTDATGFFNAEFFAPLKPASEWPSGMNKERLTSEMLAKLQADFLGVEFNFSQYLQDNVSEAVSGVKGENSIKLFGNDLEALTKAANQIKNVLANVRGITDLAVFTSLGQPTVQIDIDRARAGRYGLTPGDINSTIRAAIGGDFAGELYVPNSDQHFPIIVRLTPRYRQSPEAIRDISVGIQGEKGVMQIPLSEVATVDLVSGAAYIYREQQQRYLPIKFSVRDRDLGSTIAEAQRKIAEQVVLPPGSRLEWLGEFGNLQDAIARLRIVVPVTLGLIALLLWINFGSLRDTLLAMSVIPMAVTGGVIGLFLTGVPFSVSAAIGFIALFGISVMNGIIVLSQYTFLTRGGMEQTQAILQTGALQLRPVLMTCVIAGVGLLPAAISSGIGSQVQKPLAIVVVSGMTLAPILILLVLPALMAFFLRRTSSTQQLRAQPEVAD